MDPYDNNSNTILEQCSKFLNTITWDIPDDMPLVERLRSMGYSPMFSFWAEIQKSLLLAADEIDRLNSLVDKGKL